VVADGALQVEPLQHPDAHDAASQTQLPMMHCWPAPHAAPEPQWQVPFEAQLSETIGSHGVHELPLIPQFANDDWTHVLPWQQPVGHDVELQTHAMFRQTWPAPHAGPVPQLQAPDAEQLSAFVESHAEHALPPEPQAVIDGVSHVAPEQHPLAHVCVQPEHALPAQLDGDGQGLQEDPPVPHASFAVPGMHWLVLEQHPLGHDVALQTQAPPMHSCPAWHAALPPHVQTPALEHPSAVAPHVAHEAPAVPHAEGPGCSHTPLLQHPEGQDCALQTHWPFMHARPTPHAAPVPQEHVPRTLQPSDWVMLQIVQEAPPVPHADGVGGMVQVPALLQQPLGQDVASHTQLPLTQRWPAAHAGALPQEQAPALEQLSVLVGSHARHADPPAPHALTERPLHVGPEQQPVAHVIEQPLHVPLLHVSPVGQLMHAEPPLPQAPGTLPVWQVPVLSQHPLGHEVPSHTQAPLRHRCPVGQAGFDPHLHLPPTHISAVSAAQAMHAPPPVPQAPIDWGVQVWWSSQHPLGQEAASHVH
jgi:hypothetical protein